MSSYVEKGTQFEMEVALGLSMIPGVRVLVNYRVYSPLKGSPTQIDVVLLTPFAYFCVEAKSSTSGVTGYTNDAMWLYRTFSHTSYLPNPIYQNTMHTRALSHKIYKETKQMLHFENIILVPDTCLIQTDSPMVMNFSTFISFIKRNCGRVQKPLDVEGLYNFLKKRGE